MRRCRFIPILFSLAIGVEAFAAPLPPHTGDINGDGAQNISDVGCFISASLANAQKKPNPPCQAIPDAEADLNCDGSLGVADVQRIIQIVLTILSKEDPQKWYDPACLASAPEACLQGLAPDAPWPMQGYCADRRAQGPHAGPSSNTIGWTYAIPPGNLDTWGEIAVESDGTIYAGAEDGHLYALHPNGTLKWEYPSPFGEAFMSSPVLGKDGTIYIGGYGKWVGTQKASGHLLAVAADGTLKWSFPVGGMAYESPAIGPDGTIYAGGKDTKLYAIHPDGTLKWEYKTFGYVSSPAVDSAGNIFIGIAGGNTSNCFDVISPDGEFQWGYYQSFDKEGCDGPMLGKDGVVYVTSQSRLHAVVESTVSKGSPGEALWVMEVEENNPFHGMARGTDGTIYATIGSTLHAISSDGETKWKYPIGAMVGHNAPILDANGTVYVPCWGNHKVYAVQADGALKWEAALQGAPYTAAALGKEGIIYIGDADGKLYAIGNTPTN